MKRKKYGVGIIGFGGIARSCHVPGWKKLQDVEILAAADSNASSLKKAREEHGIPRVFEDYRKMLDMGDIDIVDICAPNRHHFRMTVDALGAGKHVICEKPLAVSAVEARSMINQAKSSGRHLMAAQHQRFLKQSSVVKTMIDDGVFGEIYHASARALRRRRLPARETFIRKELSGGGPMLDIGVHVLDLTYWFMGSPKVHSVKGATYTRLAKRKDIRGAWGEWDREAYDVEDFATGFIRFYDGRTVSLACSFLANMEKAEDFSTTLFGTEAGMEFPGGRLAVEKGGVLQDIELKFDALPDISGHHEELRIFLDCVKSGRNVPVKPEESLEVVKMLEGIYVSAETGREVVF